jgi:tetraacyldisaccharide 4'-kinase
LAVPYGLAAAWHRGVYARGWCRAGQLPCVVVSIGNLVVGGSAKTPLAAAVATLLRDAGERVALASRGYGREGGGGIEVVSDGRHIRSSSARAGDEPWLLAGLVPGVPVLVGRDRRQVGLRAISAFATEVLVLDDGFQHHRLAREVSLVCVDARGGFGNQRVLPAGPLREPAAALAAADAFVIVDGELSTADRALLERHAGAAPRFSARRSPERLWELATREARAMTLLEGREIGLLSAIARPAALRHTVSNLGARIVAERHFRDHHRYRPQDVDGLAKEASLWVTTEKDAMKLRTDWFVGVTVVVLGIDLVFEDPLSFARDLRERVDVARRAKRVRGGRGVRVV